MYFFIMIIIMFVLVLYIIYINVVLFIIPCLFCSFSHFIVLFLSIILSASASFFFIKALSPKIGLPSNIMTQPLPPGRKEAKGGSRTSKEKQQERNLKAAKQKGSKERSRRKQQRKATKQAKIMNTKIHKENKQGV